MNQRLCLVCKQKDRDRQSLNRCPTYMEALVKGLDGL